MRHDARAAQLFDDSIAPAAVGLAPFPPSPKGDPIFRERAREKISFFVGSLRSLVEQPIVPVLGPYYVSSVRLFNRSAVRAFADAHAHVRQTLLAWFAEVEAACWAGPADVKRRFASASFITNDRIVFNIKGNEYRVVVAVKYPFHVIYIRFIGTHAEYEIDARSI